MIESQLCEEEFHFLVNAMKPVIKKYQNEGNWDAVMECEQVIRKLKYFTMPDWLRERMDKRLSIEQHG